MFRILLITKLSVHYIRRAAAKYILSRNPDIVSPAAMGKSGPVEGRVRRGRLYPIKEGFPAAMIGVTEIYREIKNRKLQREISLKKEQFKRLLYQLE